MQDLYNEISVAQSLAPAARTASANGAGVDLQGFDAAVVVVETGAITDGTHTIQVEESADNSTFTAVADADLQGTEPAIGAADDNKVYEIGYMGTKRWLRVSVTVSGATSGGVYAAHVVRGRARKLPK
ncbi:MAG TPA: hypothetical protein VNO79_02715 [Actinomycetota bacterium]|nr:hypothetical protein [Actinomycetota bacterium]